MASAMRVEQFRHTRFFSENMNFSSPAMNQKGIHSHGHENNISQSNSNINSAGYQPHANCVTSYQQFQNPFPSANSQPCNKEADQAREEMQMQMHQPDQHQASEFAQTGGLAGPAEMLASSGFTPIPTNPYCTRCISNILPSLIHTDPQTLVPRVYLKHMQMHVAGCPL